jgi:hypothetical protein
VTQRLEATKYFVTDVFSSEDEEAVIDNVGRVVPMRSRGRAINEVQAFRDLKGFRDRLSQGEKFDEGTLPTR